MCHVNLAISSIPEEKGFCSLPIFGQTTGLYNTQCPKAPSNDDIGSSLLIDLSLAQSGQYPKKISVKDKAVFFFLPSWTVCYNLIVFVLTPTCQ